MASIAVALVTLGVSASAWATAASRTEQLDSARVGAAPPRGVVLDCDTQSGIGAGLREFRSRWNVVVGPLALDGGAIRPAFYAEMRNKFPAFVKGGHRVTLELPIDVRPEVGLKYGPRPKSPRLVRDGYRVVTFVSCGRGQVSRGSGSTAWPVSFWSGGVLARSAQCVPLRVWVDDDPTPRRAVIYLGVTDCS
jgi:hypothetical protein